MSSVGEYICISCWTSFIGAPNPKGELTCPHCSYAQPAADDYLTQGGEDASASTAPTSDPQIEPAALDMTLQDVKMPWAGDTQARAEGQPSELEPISFDDLEELEDLLGGGAESEAAPPAPDAGSPPSTPDADDDPAQEAEPGPGDVIWQIKSESGLTYSFFSADSMISWAKGLSAQKNLLISIDGIAWKPLAPFQSAYVEGGDALGAFRGTAAHRPARTAAPQPAPQKTINAAAKPTRSTRAPSQAIRRTGNLSRVTTRPNPTGQHGAPDPLAAAMNAAVAAEGGAPARSNTSTGQRRRPTRTSSTVPRSQTGNSQAQRGQVVESNSWPGRLAFLGVGILVGGTGVYFGLYLLGFYNLTFAF